MSELKATFNEKGIAKLEAAAKAFGFDSNETAADFALMLLEFATKAKKTGRDLAVIQDIRTESGASITVDELLDLKNTVQGPDGKGYRMPSISFRPQ